MSSAAASRMVLVSGALLVVFALLQRRPNLYRTIWAIGALTLGLAVLADFVPSVAGPFALLILVAAAARSRGELGALLGGDASSPPAPAAPSRPARGPGSPRMGE